MMGYLLKTWDELAIGQRFSFVTLTAIGLTLIAMLLYGYRSVGDLLVGLLSDSGYWALH